LQFNDYLDAIRADSDLLVSAALKGMGAEIPAYPGWTARELVVHTGQVHWSKGEVVRDRRTENRDSDDVAVPPDSELIDWFIKGSEMLVDTLAMADPATPVWTWIEDDQTASFWFRRMAHETLIHRVDAEQAHGSVTSTSPELCADGIDEILTRFIGGPPGWASIEEGEGIIELRAFERSWFIRRDTYSGTTPSGRFVEKDWVYNPVDPVSEPATIVSGTAQAMSQWLWGRGSITDLTVMGDAESAVKLRADSAEAT